MIFIDELKNFKIYRKQFFLPYNDKDKKHGSLVYLLTPNYISSKNLMNFPLSINRKYYESYYFERNAAYYINSGKIKKDELLEEAVQEQDDSAFHNEFDYEGFDEYMLLPKGSEVSSVNNTYYETILNAIKTNRLNNGEYDVYVHPINHPEDPTYIGTVAVQVIQHSFYDAFYKWIAWEEIEDEGDYIEEGLEEGYIGSKKDIEYNVDKWKNGDINILFVTGHSGSGKSVHARGLAKEYNANIFEIDHFEMASKVFYKENRKLTKGEEIFKKIFESKYKGPKSFDDLSDKDFYKEQADFIKLLIKYANSHKSEKFIIEGIQIANRIYDHTLSINDLKPYAVLVKGTSILKSDMRALKRDYENFKKMETYPNSFEWFKAAFAEYIVGSIKTAKIRNDRLNNFEKELSKINESYTAEEELINQFLNGYSLETQSLNENSFDYSENITDRFNVVARDGSDNACVIINVYDKPLRGRSSILILKEIDGKYYLFCDFYKENGMFSKTGDIKSAGGGWNIDESPLNAAIREAGEETLMSVKDIMHFGSLIEYSDDKEKVADWVKENVPEDKWWYGYYSEVFVGLYDGPYKDNIAEKDLDEIAEKGKWISVEDIQDKSPKAYVNAINNYIDFHKITEETSLIETQIACKAIQEEFITEQAVLLEQLEYELLEISQSDIDKNKKLEPIFVVNTYTDSRFGRIVRKVTKDPYSHVLISFDPSLKRMYSFDFKSKILDNKKDLDVNGFAIDSIDRYRAMATNNIKVTCMMVTSKVKKALEKTIEFYKVNMEKTKYGILNLLDYLRGSKKLSSFKDLTLFCSEFVDSLLKSVNIDISGHSSRNTAPSDLGKYTEKNNFFKIFEGKANDYDEIEITKEIEEFKNTIPYKQLNAIKPKKLVTEGDELADKLKYLARSIKMKNKRGIYKFNANRRKAQLNLPTVNSVAGSVNVPSVNIPQPSVGAHESADFINSVKHALVYENPNSYYMNEDTIAIFNEADIKYDAPLRKIIWNDRIRSNKEVLKLYAGVKNDIPWIKYTFVNLSRYQNRNVFYDLSFYNELFFKNNTFKLDKAVNLYYDFLGRLLDKSRVPGYSKKTIFIPVLDWVNDPRTRTWLYRDTINPISVLHRIMYGGLGKAKQLFGDADLIFFGKDCYFKINFSELTAEQEKSAAMLFKNFIIKMERGQQFDPDEEDQSPDNIESRKVIVTNIVDKIETNGKVNMSTQSDFLAKVATGKAYTGMVRQVRPDDKIDTKINPVKPITAKEKKEVVKKDNEEAKKLTDKTTTSTDISKVAKAEKQMDVENTEKIKKDLISDLNNLAASTANTDEMIEKINDDDYIKELIMQLTAEEDSGIKINQARIDRMTQLNKQFMTNSVKGKTVEEILNPKNEQANAPLPKTTIKVDSPFEDEWKDLKYINFDRSYDVNDDIVKMIYELSKKQYPIAIRNIDVQDNSTSEDYVDTYTVEIEDFRGKRGTIKFDVPKFKDNKYLILGGYKKTIQNQYFNMPILKTEQDTVQIISNYNKIFIRRFGNTKGKSIAYADQLIKALSKYTGRNIKVVYGDNSKLADNYDMPIDYIDIGSVIYSIVAKMENEEYHIFFNQTELREKYKDIIDYTRGFPVGVNITNGKVDVIYYTNNDTNDYPFSLFLVNILCEIPQFAETFNDVKAAKKFVYSQASILNQRIPLIIVCAYSEGLLPVLNKAKIDYELMTKLPTEIRKDFQKDWIQFEDGYLVYNINYDSSMFMNGLKEVDTLQYSIDQVNDKRMWVEMLDNYGGRIIADGLENFYECMLDPITMEVLEHYKLPQDYISLMIYANALLSDNKFIAHGDASSRRLRRNELIAVKVYKTLFNDGYATYATGIRHYRNNTVFNIKQSAVIDKFMTDTISSDLSIANCLNDIETVNSVTTKGESGMNSARSYTLNKRIYDTSMLNLLGMSTGFAGTVGVTRQATINMNIDSARGYVKSIEGDTSKMNTANSLTITEALSPMGSTHDDPMRVAMTFVQTSKHQVRTAKSDPLLVTSGADAVLPYLTSDIFCKKSKKAGQVLEVTDTYMTVKYNDGTNDYIDLSNRIEKNSDGGFFVGVKLDTEMKPGQKFGENHILAYDKKSFSKGTAETNNLVYDVGKLAKVAIINSDDNFEDSAVITTKFSEDLATNVILKESRVLDCKTNIYNYLKKGTIVQQEDILYETQTAYEEEDVNLLLKSLAGDSGEISKLGRKQVKAPVTGRIAGVKVYRSCEIEDMSESLQKFVKEIESESKAVNKKMNELGIKDPTITGSITKLEPKGKLKNAPDSVLIEYYIEYHDIMAVGDKLTIFAANKGVVHNIIPSEVAPYTDFRPDEEISLYTGIATINKRQIASNLIVGSLNKLCIELGRSVRDILGIPYIENEIDI